MFLNSRVVKETEFMLNSPVLDNGLNHKMTKNEMEGNAVRGKETNRPVLDKGLNGLNF